GHTQSTRSPQGQWAEAAGTNRRRLVRNIENMAITAVSTVSTVREKFPQAVVETVEFRGEQTIVLHPEFLVGVCSYLQKNLRYTYLSSVTAVDWLERIPRYDVV